MLLQLLFTRHQAWQRADICPRLTHKKFTQGRDGINGTHAEIAGDANGRDVVRKDAV